MQTISTPDAPKAIGPYSQGIVMNGFLFSAGQIALDPSTMEVVSGGITEQTERVMLNLQNVLAAAGLSFNNVVKTTVVSSGYGRVRRDERSVCQALWVASTGPAQPWRSAACPAVSGWKLSSSRPSSVARLVPGLRHIARAMAILAFLVTALPAQGTSGIQPPRLAPDSLRHRGAPRATSFARS